MSITRSAALNFNRVISGGFSSFACRSGLGLGRRDWP